MRKAKRGSWGFTIIELLVVLAVIALLASVVVAIFSQFRAKTRDVRREKDVKVLQEALAIYVNNAGTYPATDGSGVYLTGSDAVSAVLVSSGAVPAIPSDPRSAGDFRYHYLSADGISYTLTYYLETDSVPGKNAGQQQTGP